MLLEESTHLCIDPFKIVGGEILFDGKDFPITEDTGKALLNWLGSGVKPEPKPAPAPEALEQITAKGVLEEVKSRDTETGKKYGFPVRFLLLETGPQQGPQGKHKKK